MKRRHHIIAEVGLLIILLIVGLVTLMLGSLQRGSASAGVTGAADTQITAVASRLPSLPPTLSTTPEPLPTQIPKPNETGVPTPFPTVIVPERPLPTSQIDKPTPVSVSQPALDAAEPWQQEVSQDLAPRHILVDIADVIAIGRVKQVQPARWTTADGKRPANPHAPNNQETIFRPVLIEVEQYLHGEQRQPILVVFAYGGTVGQDSARAVDGNIWDYREGERVVVFLDHDSRGRSVGNAPLYLTTTHYTINGNEQATNTLETVSLQQLINEISQAKRTEGQ